MIDDNEFENINVNNENNVNNVNNGNKNGNENGNENGNKKLKNLNYENQPLLERGLILNRNIYNYDDTCGEKFAEHFCSNFAIYCGCVWMLGFLANTLCMIYVRQDKWLHIFVGGMIGGFIVPVIIVICWIIREIKHGNNKPSIQWLAPIHASTFLLPVIFSFGTMLGSIISFIIIS
tara:strand:- start:6988 stop:7518 length:531 start_codon:yes stop_codon:yes gene_type:complete